MSKKEEVSKKTKAKNAPAPEHAIATKIMNALDRVHQRIPKF